MNEADRAEWLARVEGMTREERIDEIFKVITGGFTVPRYAQDDRALDLIAALERAAMLRAADIAYEWDSYVADKIRAEAQP